MENYVLKNLPSWLAAFQFRPQLDLTLAFYDDTTAYLVLRLATSTTSYQYITTLVHIDLMWFEVFDTSKYVELLTR